MVMEAQALGTQERRLCELGSRGRETGPRTNSILSRSLCSPVCRDSHAGVMVRDARNYIGRAMEGQGWIKTGNSANRCTLAFGHLVGGTNAIAKCAKTANTKTLVISPVLAGAANNCPEHDLGLASGAAMTTERASAFPACNIFRNLPFGGIRSAGWRKPKK